MAEPYKVMLIDDDCGVHTLIKRILEDAGYSYCGAYGGEEGRVANVGVRLGSRG